MEIMFINCCGQLVSTTKFCYYHKISLSEVKYNVTSLIIMIKLLTTEIFTCNTMLLKNTLNLTTNTLTSFEEGVHKGTDQRIPYSPVVCEPWASSRETSNNYRYVNRNSPVRIESSSGHNCCRN